MARPQPQIPDPVPPEAPPKRGIRAFVAKYGHMLWWLHSLYALGLGIFVVIFAQKGFFYARWLAVMLAAVWVVVMVFFRVFGRGAREKVQGVRAKLRFYVMTYVLKNLYQGMLFFLLPFYWRSATFDAENQWFVVVLGLCAFLSTLDVVFDQVLMRWKSAASGFYFLTLFACTNLVIPSLLPNTRSLVSLIVAAIIASLGFFTMHFPFKALGRPLILGALVTVTAGSAAGAYFGRVYVPPVSMYVSAGAVGPKLLEDGRLALEAHVLHVSYVEQLHAVTDVVIPGGKGDRLVHVWRHDGEVVHRAADVDSEAHGPTGTMRLRSQLEELPEDPTGEWIVDVTTMDGQLVGRVAFSVID